jgi:hypothetical protein
MVKDEIKNRVIYLYPKLPQAEKWKEAAEKRGMTLSKFVIEHVENSMRQEEDDSYQPRVALIKRIRELEEAFTEARKEARMMRIVADKLEKENRNLRTAPFLDEEFQGVRQYEKELVDLLMGGGRLKDEDILSELGIDKSDTDSVKAISNQLTSLEAYGLVKATAHGWMWSK